MNELPSWEIEAIQEAAIDDDLDLAIRKLLASDMGAGFATSRYYQDIVPAFSLFCRKDGQVVGHVSVVSREIRVGDTPLMVGGIQNVVVAKALRGSRIAFRLMKETANACREHQLPYGLLFCLPTLERFYGHFGWQRIEHLVTMLDAEGNDALLPSKNITMTLDLSETPFPEGNVHLQGRDW